MVKKDSTITNAALYKQFPKSSKSSIRVYANDIRNSVISQPKAVMRPQANLQGASGIASQPGIGGPHPSLIPSAPSIYKKDYSSINIKKLVKNWSIYNLMNNSKFSGQALATLTKSEFLEQGEIKHGVFWTSDMPPYRRPDFFYPWQNTGIDMMHDPNIYGMMWQAGRQKIGKTTGAFNYDFEAMLQIPGTVVTLVAPGKEQAKVLLRQGFKEMLTLEDGSKFDLWNQLYKPYFIVDNAYLMAMKNGSMLQVIPLSEFTTPGYATDILHIEELDKVVKDPQKLRGLGAILPTIRARRDRAKIIITCNNDSTVYRILREEIKVFGPRLFPIYMEKPYNIESENFSGLHHIYNQYVDYVCPDCKKLRKQGKVAENGLLMCYHKPDVDEILKVIIGVAIGKGYMQSQLGNLDDYAGDMFNPDKLMIAFAKGKTYIPKRRYEHTGMGIDPGAVHGFGIVIYAKEGNGLGMEVTKLWTARFSISGRTEKERQKMIKTIAKTCARAYIQYDCEFVASESNSGAKLIVDFIGYYVDKFLSEPSAESPSHAYWQEPIWSNFGGDKEQGKPDGKIHARADFIMLLSVLIDFQLITIPVLSDSDHVMKMEFARYKPADKGSKDARYKGDMVDASLHCCWHLCGGMDFLDNFLSLSEGEEDVFTA